MDMVSANQMSAARQAGDTLRSAGGIVQDARELRAMTDQMLTRFDAYVAEMQKTRTRDEGFEKRTAELMTKMEKQQAALGKTLEALSARVDAMPDAKGREATEAALAGIREATESLQGSVQAISETLTALSEEV